MHRSLVGLAALSLVLCAACSSSDSDSESSGKESSTNGIGVTSTGSVVSVGGSANVGSGGSASPVNSATSNGAGGSDSGAASGGASTSSAGSGGENPVVENPTAPECPNPMCRAGDDEISCCARELVVGGSFQMGRSASGGDACPADQNCPGAELPEHDASTSSFELDVFEVTVSRFRQFVENYDDFELSAGMGAHPRIEGSGWQTEWSDQLPAERSALEAGLACDPLATYTPEPADHETMPVNCVTWFEAFAFCVFAGGRLPTELEWEYAAAGGANERLYPWGDAEPNPERARFFPQALDDVGSAPQGIARWGQHDLGGNVWEWGLDWLDTAWYAGGGDPCDDCARLQGSDYRVIRGGAYAFEAVTLRAATRSGEGPSERAPFIGFRCAAAPDL